VANVPDRSHSPEPPLTAGRRLGVVIGSSLGAHPFVDTTVRRITVEGNDHQPVEVELHERDDLVVLMRHGPDGTVPAHLVDHHANVLALHAAGCARVLALGSAGALHGHLGPGTVVAPDDFLALGTYPTFHDTTDGYRMAGIDVRWRARVIEAWRSATITPIVDGGTYAMVRGPRFETRAEIRLLASFADLVGMTWPAECILAGEAGLPYAVVCKVDNLANGVEGHTASVEEYRERTAADAVGLSADLVGVVEALLAD
jgi:5'-methylthioadenosine phosphorylase